MKPLFLSEKNSLKINKHQKFIGEDLFEEDEEDFDRLDNNNLPIFSIDSLPKEHNLVNNIIDSNRTKSNTEANSNQ